MLIQTQTLKTSLETLIDQHGLPEVLDRLTDIIHASKPPHYRQITTLLERTVELALLRDQPNPPQPVLTPLSLICSDVQTHLHPSPQN